MQRVWSTYYDSTSRPQSADSQADDPPPNFNFSFPRRGPAARMNDGLTPPRPPFSSLPHVNSSPSLRSAVSGLDTPIMSSSAGSIKSSKEKDGSGISLTVNYLPTKFSRPHSPGIHKRKGKGEKDMLPKTGGGREAFGSGAARMPGANDEDYDGIIPSQGKTKPRMRWNRFKWTLFCSNVVFTFYSLTTLIVCLLTWFNVWTNADVIRVGNRTELILSTLAASVGVLTSLIGWSGILLNNRAFLAIYTLMLWVTFALLVVPGYVTFRRRSNNLEGKINAQWSRDLGATGRLRIQNELNCCGYFNPFSEATVSQSCYARSQLPGCKGPYLKFERKNLEKWYIVVFSLVPLQIACIIASLLCSNHVTYRFGKGMMPKAYRLSLNSMAVIMDNYANQLAEQYGADVASDVVARTRHNVPGGFGPGSSQVNLIESVPIMGYDSQSPSPSPSMNHSTPSGFSRPYTDTPGTPTSGPLYDGGRPGGATGGGGGAPKYTKI